LNSSNVMSFSSSDTWKPCTQTTDPTTGEGSARVPSGRLSSRVHERGTDPVVDELMDRLVDPVQARNLTVVGHDGLAGESEGFEKGRVRGVRARVLIVGGQPVGMGSSEILSLQSQAWATPNHDPAHHLEDHGLIGRRVLARGPAGSQHIGSPCSGGGWILSQGGQGRRESRTSASSPLDSLFEPS
jgi:hypothetical protein